MEPTETLVDQNEVADLLSLSPRTLEGWRTDGVGPPYVKLGAKTIRYRMSEVHDWLNSHQQEA